MSALMERLDHAGILAVFVAIGTFGAFIVELGNALNWFPE